jgi:alkylhydroperoxidase family enzyme
MLLTPLIERRLRREERLLGEGTLDYLRMLWRTSRPAFWAFASAGRFLRFRRQLPLPVHHAARIAAIRAEDCGTCLQMSVRLALADRIDASLVRALATGPAAALPAPLDRVVAFAEAVVRADDAAVAELRPGLEAELGSAALAELAVTIAGARVYPTTKRALGLAISCSRVEVTV